MNSTSDGRGTEPESIGKNPSASTDTAARTAVGFVASGFIPLVLLADTFRAIQNGWNVGLWLEWVILWAIGIWCFACVTLLLVPQTRVRYSRHSSQLVVMYGAVGLLLVLGQMVFSTIDPIHEVSFHQRLPNQIKHFRPQSINMRGIHGESTYTISSRGIRGPELDSTYDRRLLFVGASTTECMYLDDTETWPYLCAERLQQDSSDAKIWAGSVGKSGYTTVQHLRYAQQNEQFSEYDTAMFMIGAGDLLIWLNYTGPAPVPPLWERTGYFTLLRTFFGIVWPWTDPMAADPTGSNLQVIRHRRASGNSVDIHPPAGRLLQTYEQRIIEIIDTCESKGVQPVFITQPTLWSKDGEQDTEADLWGGRMRGTDDYLKIPKLRELLDRLNGALLRVCATHDVPCVNLEKMHENEEFFYDDFHFTEAGARAVAVEVADMLLNTAEY